MVIRRVNPISVAKIAGLLYGIIGLIIGAFISLIAMAVGTLGAGAGDHAAGPMMGMLFGAGAIIVMPLFYGVVSAIASALTAMIYNLLAGWVGGIEIEVDTAPTPR
jgi:hypothetical protein